MITVSNLFVKYGDRVLFDNINIVIKNKDRVGLVGRNGAGKSTMLKIIAGDMLPDGGDITMPSESTIGFLYQEMNLPKGKTVIEETFTAFKEAISLEKELADINEQLEIRTDYESDAYEKLIQDLSDISERLAIIGGGNVEGEAIKVLKGLGFKDSDMKRLTDEFSGGWKMRIELAKMLLQKPDYLLLDEPTNHLDIESIVWLEGFLKHYEGTVILISHDKMFLDAVTNRTIEIELGKVHDYKANYSKYLTLRKERREILESAYKNQQKDIAQREKTINRFMAKATKTKMAQSMKKQLDKVERIEIEQEDSAAMNIKFPPAPRSGEIVLEADNLSKSYGAIKVLNDVEFKMDRGDRIAFVGQNGQGKTTLSKILIGVENATAGNIKLGHNVQIGYYAQNQAETLHSNLTVLQTLENAAPSEMRTKVRAILGAFMFSGEDVEKKVMVLSGGERARLAMASMLLKPFNLLVLDEPTNHLDIISKEVLKQALIDYDGSLIIVSHDRDFLGGLTDKTIEFREQKLHTYLGDVNFFLDKRQLENMREVEKRDKHEKQKQVLSQAEIKELEKEKKKLQRQVQYAERDIEMIEQEISEYEAEMSNPDFYNSDNSAAILEKYNLSKETLDVAMERWEKTQEELDNFLIEHSLT